MVRTLSVRRQAISCKVLQGPGVLSLGAVSLGAVSMDAVSLGAVSLGAVSLGAVSPCIIPVLKKLR